MSSGKHGRTVDEMRRDMEERREKVRSLLVSYRAQYGADYPVVLVKEQPEVERRPWYGVVIHPSTRPGVQVQMTYFDARGFSSHDGYKTNEEAVWDAWNSGLRIPDPDRLERAVLSEEFKISY